MTERAGTVAHEATRPSETRRRLDSIDALRGLAALWVCALHARENLWIGLRESTRRRASNFDVGWWLDVISYPFSLGAAGVMLFFVLSGYCVHRPYRHLVPQSGGRIPWWPYLRRRASRIYPALIGALLLTWVLDSLTAARVPDDHKLGEVGWGPLLINLTNLQGVLGPVFGSNGPLWSLAVEFQLYLVYPLLFGLLRSLGPLRSLGLAWVLSLAGQLMLWAWFPGHFCFLPYVFTWYLGVFVAEVEVGRAARVFRSRPVAAFVLVTVLGFGLKMLGQAFAANVVLGCSFAMLLAWSIGDRGRVFWGQKAWVPFVKLGVFSYSLYVVHVPLLVFARAYTLDGRNASSQYVAWVGVVGCVVAARLFFEIFERWSIRVHRPPTRASAG